MADNEQVPAPDGTTVEPTADQPQTDPNAAPQGMTAPDDQQGTTGDAVRAEKEQLYQTKYQQLKAEQEALMSELGTYQEMYGPINQAQSQPQTPTDQPFTTAQQEAEDQGFDPYDPESMQRYFEHRFNMMQSKLADVAKNAIVQAREQERIESEQREVFSKFDKWCKKNDVPEDLIQKAAQEFASRFDASRSRPHAIVEWVSDFIVKHSEIEKGNTSLQQQVTDAVEKAKALAAAEQPAPGAPPGVASQHEKTPQEAWADEIAPDEREPEFN